MKRTGEEIIETHGGRILRSSNRKDTHSKVQTSRGSRERRVRLAADTAIQFYDVQDRLGYDRPSKAVDWLIQKAKAAIDNLAEPPPTGVLIEPNSPPPSPLVDENHTKLSAFEPQNFTSFPDHFMHSNELCLSLQSLEENLSSQISSTYDRNPISSGSCTTNFEETNYPRPMSWNGDVTGNYRAVRSRSFEYDFNLQQHSVYSNSGTGEPVKSSHVLLPDFHTWDQEQQQQLRSTISGTHFTPRGLSWGSGL